MLERGDLLLVPFPVHRFVGHQAAASLALTDADRYGDFIALPVTSRPQTEHGVPIAMADLVGGSLPAASWIRTNRIVTLNISLVVKTVGRVSETIGCIDAAALRLYRFSETWLIGCALQGGAAMTVRP